MIGILSTRRNDYLPSACVRSFPDDRIPVAAAGDQREFCPVLVTVRMNASAPRIPGQRLVESTGNTQHLGHPGSEIDTREPRHAGWPLLLALCLHVGLLSARRDLPRQERDRLLGAALSTKKTAQSDSSG